jgi:hypothetical protein
MERPVNRSLIWAAADTLIAAHALSVNARPILHGFQNDPTADALHDHLSFTFGKPAFAWKADSLATAVLEQLCAMTSHDQKYIPASMYANP